jgi:hypothetical protein
MSQPVNVGQKTLNDILIWIVQRGDDIQNAPEQVQSIQEQIAIYYKKINGLELEAMLTAGAPGMMSMLDKDVFIYLPPIEKGNYIVPILCLEYDYATEIPELILKIALFLFDGEQNLKAIGYRFETANKQGRHCYCHIQHIDGLGRHKLPPGIEWIPKEYPAFPIDAQDPVELLVCMLVSLYDLAIIKNLEGKYKTLIKSNVEKMKLYRSIT